MMRTGLRLLGCHSEEAVIVGDRMDTDIIAGMESGVDTVLVLSGVSDMDTAKTFAYRPTEILHGVGCIVERSGCASSTLDDYHDCFGQRLSCSLR